MNLGKATSVYNHITFCLKPTTKASGFQTSMRYEREAKRQKRGPDAFLLEAVKYCEPPAQQSQELLGHKAPVNGLREVAEPCVESWRRSSADQHILKAFHVSSKREAQVRLSQTVGKLGKQGGKTSDPRMYT